MLADPADNFQPIAGTGRMFVIHDRAYDHRIPFPLEKILKPEPPVSHKVVSGFFQIIKIDRVIDVAERVQFVAHDGMVTLQQPLRLHFVLK